MGSDYVALLLEGLPDPADQPDPADPADPADIFYYRMTREMWSHVRPIAETVELPGDRPTDAQVRLYLSALARIAVHWWNPYKYGLVGDYHGIPDIRPKQTYLGHNIAALAVDDLGRVIDFEMNHNDLFRSSAEHAESRLVRRLYQLGQRLPDLGRGLRRRVRRHPDQAGQGHDLHHPAAVRAVRGHHDAGEGRSRRSSSRPTQACTSPTSS